MKRNLCMLISVMMILSLSLVGCGGGNDTANTAAQSTVQPAASAASTAAEAAADPLGKYDPQIELSTITFRMDTDIILPDGDSAQNNIWTRTLQDELGIKLNVLWGAPSDQSEQKVSLMIASDELPDFFMVTPLQYKQLQAAGKLEDLTDSYDKYATPLVKEKLFSSTIGKNALLSASENNRIFAIPYELDHSERITMLWVRTDWLKKVNLPEPKSVDDVVKIADAFVNQDPDGNGKNDTYGLALFGSSGWVIEHSFEPFFNSFHADQKTWVKDSSGKLVNSITQPEMKNALLKMQEMYKAGLIDKEFGVKDSNKVAEDFASGRLGLAYSYWWLPEWPGQLQRDADPKAEWKAFPLPSIDDKPAMVFTPAVYSEYYQVAKKGIKNPEAIIKILNLVTEKINGPKSEAKYYIDPVTRNNPWKIAPIYCAPSDSYVTYYREIQEALKSGSPANLSETAKMFYDQIEKFKGGDNSQWYINAEYGQDGAFGIDDYYYKNDLLKYDEFYGAPTPSMVSNQPVLTKMFEETLSKVIMGADISEWDNFITQWKQLGGDAITKEVNDWKDKQPK